MILRPDQLDFFKNHQISLIIRVGSALVTIGATTVELKPLDWLRLRLAVQPLKNPPQIPNTNSLVDWMNCLSDLQARSDVKLSFPLSIDAKYKHSIIRLNSQSVDEFISLLS